MYAQVSPSRHCGDELPGWQRGPKMVYGWVCMREELVPELKRHVKVVRVRGISGQDVIRPLVNGEFVFFDGRISISGWEKHSKFPSGFTLYVQNWEVQPVTEIECRR